MPTAPKSIRAKRVKRQERRQNSTQRGYTMAWRRAAAAWLREQFAAGLVRCAGCGKLLDGARRDIHVDHIVPHRGRALLFWDETNWQAMHAACHSRKTCFEQSKHRSAYSQTFLTGAAQHL